MKDTTLENIQVVFTFYKPKRKKERNLPIKHVPFLYNEIHDMIF